MKNLPSIILSGAMIFALSGIANANTVIHEKFYRERTIIIDGG